MTENVHSMLQKLESVIIENRDRNLEYAAHQDRLITTLKLQIKMMRQASEEHFAGHDCAIRGKYNKGDVAKV